MDAVEQANSGHPGTPMALAPVAYLLWTRHLRHNPANPGWEDRDRFVLSCGHASMLLYSLLHLSGYDLPLEEIRNFRQWHSRTPGHPERGHTAGVEVTTGPLGQGIGNAVGMAMAERFLASRFNRARCRHRRSPHLGAGERRRPDGGSGQRGGKSRGASEARQARAHLRRQPDHHRRQHRAELHRGREPPLRGLWLARAARGRRQRPRRHRHGPGHRSRRIRAAHAHRAAHRHRRSGPDQAQHQRSPWRAPGRRRSTPHQGASLAGPRTRSSWCRRRRMPTWAAAVPMAPTPRPSWQAAFERYRAAYPAEARGLRARAAR